MRKKDRAEAFFEILAELYPEAICSLNYETPLQLLIATQLSAQCTDARVNIVTETLFKKYPDAVSFANADLKELEQDIKSTGFYHNKAKNIIACCNKILSDFNGEIPDNMEDMLKLGGVGRKTANLVLGDIFGKGGMVIDTHAKRIMKRIGLTNETEPVKVERDTEKLLPRHMHSEFCHRLVLFGREYCMARNPKCNACPAVNICKEGFAIKKTEFK